MRTLGDTASHKVSQLIAHPAALACRKALRVETAAEHVRLEWELTYGQVAEHHILSSFKLSPTTPEIAIDQWLVSVWAQDADGAYLNLLDAFGADREWSAEPIAVAHREYRPPQNMEYTIEWRFRVGVTIYLGRDCRRIEPRGKVAKCV